MAPSSGTTRSTVKHTKARPVNLATQRAALERRLPGGRSRTARSELTWMGHITPSPLSATYTVRVRYKLGKRLSVKVLDPELHKREGERPPHLFSKTTPFACT